ncbi:hypothetical protein [Methylobacterium nodulans]|uniref:Uncharacterized protein n=1 Tax=Methylobacterium nodulans (strain LMG 21967 / CNCM I-2342 / ORS 2060) TaxID=460265 RepID=B8ISC2_METNO|nr:hypothetical protein [Methylobacterium nodulans]ACL58762.1 hypothetical protein Mnod_3862 [Methylobacterium nodulans ORS 2060]
MPRDLAGLRRDRAKASDRMNELTAAARGRSMTDDEQREFDAAAAQVRDLDAQIAAEEAERERTTAASLPRADAAEIARLCVEGGVPAMAATLLAEGVSTDDAKKRVAAAGEAKNLVMLARRKDSSIPEDLAATMLAEGKTVEQIRAALFDRLVAAEDRTSISSHPPAPQGNAGPAAAKANMKRQLEAMGLVTKEA